MAFSSSGSRVSRRGDVRPPTVPWFRAVDVCQRNLRNLSSSPMLPHREHYVDCHGPQGMPCWILNKIPVFKRSDPLIIGRYRAPNSPYSLCEQSWLAVTLDCSEPSSLSLQWSQVPFL
jgi:hypothetical protein